jgi:hypothetical protein
MSKGNRRKKVSSPASTGGAGVFFEQQVVAYWVAYLLLKGMPPILDDCVIVEVSTQAEYRGWHTDDLIVLAKDPVGKQRRLAGQVKKNFKISAKDDECKKAIGDFWNDFVTADF